MAPAYIAITYVLFPVAVCFFVILLIVGKIEGIVVITLLGNIVVPSVGFVTEGCDIGCIYIDSCVGGGDDVFTHVVSNDELFVGTVVGFVTEGSVVVGICVGVLVGFCVGFADGFVEFNKTKNGDT